MKIKPGTARGQPLVFDLPALVGAAGWGSLSGLRHRARLPPAGWAVAGFGVAGRVGLSPAGGAVANWASLRRAGVVLHSPQTLVPSSPGTTSLGPNGPTAGPAWCSPPSNPLFLRRGAPRLWGRTSQPPGGHGASLPANPYSFVAGHHVFGVKWTDRRAGVVLPSQQSLVPSSRGTTSLGPDEPTAGPAWCSPASHTTGSPRHFTLIYPTAAKKNDAGTSFRSVPASFFHHFPTNSGKERIDDARHIYPCSSSILIIFSCLLLYSAISTRTKRMAISNGKNAIIL